MNKRKYILFFVISIILTLLICYKNIKSLFDIKTLESEYSKLKEDNLNLINNINDKNEELEYLNEQFVFIEMSSEKNKELENEIEKIKEEIDNLKTKIDSINKKITEYVEKIKEIEKYVIN